MPDRAYDLPAHPLSWRAIHVPSLPRVLEDYVAGAPFTEAGGDAEPRLATTPEAQEARDRIERLFASSWDEFRELSLRPDGMGRVFAFRSYAESVIAEVKGRTDLTDEDREALSVVRFRNDVLACLLDLHVVSGRDVPTWSGLTPEQKDAMWRNVRAGLTTTQVAYLRAGSVVAGRIRERGRVPSTWTAVWKDIRGELPTALGRPDGTPISPRAVQRTFERMGLYEPAGPGHRPQPDDVREFLARVTAAHERYRVQAGEA